MDPVMPIMVVFSATSISEKIARFAIDRAANEKAKLILCDVRDQDISRKVSQMAENIGFIGIEAVKELKKQIKDERERLIKKTLKQIEEQAREKGVETETEILKGPSADAIIRIAKAKGVSTLIVQKRVKHADLETPFKVIRLK